MGVNFAVKKNGTPTATGNQDVTNSNFGGVAAKLALIFQSGHNAANDPGDTPNARIGIGAYDGVTADGRCVGAVSLDNQAATDVYRTAHVAASNWNQSPGAVTFLNARGAAMLTDGVRQNFIDVQATSYQGLMAFMGGSDFSCAVGGINLGTGTSAITTTPGIAADAILFFGTQSAGVPGDFFGQVVGMALRDGTQKCIAWAETDAVAAGGQPSQVILSNKCFAQQSITAGTQDYTVTAGNFTATAFDLTPSANAGSDTLGYVAMRFGGKSCKLWDFSTPTSTGNVSDATPLFKPDFGMIFGTNLEAMDSGAFDANTAGGLGISAFTALDQAALSWYIDATADPTNTGSDAKANAMRVGNGLGAAGVVADLVSMNSNGWTLNYTSVQANAKKAFAFAVGPRPSLVRPRQSRRFAPLLVR